MSFGVSENLVSGRNTSCLGWMVKRSRDLVRSRYNTDLYSAPSGGIRVVVQPYVTAGPVPTWCVTDLGSSRGAVDANATSRQLREWLFESCDTTALRSR